MHYSKVNTQLVTHDKLQQEQNDWWTSNGRKIKGAASQSVSLCRSHPTTNWQPASQPLSSSGTSRGNRQQKKQKMKKEKSIRFEPRWFNLLWQLCTHQWRRLSLFLSWSLTSLSSSVSLSSLCLFTSSLSPLLLLLLTLSSPTLSLACSWTEWASAALRNPVSMAVWAKQASQQDTVVQMSRGRSLTRAAQRAVKQAQ